MGADALGTATGTILIVDDEEVVRTVAQDMLEALGYEVLTAEDGKEALETYGKNRDQIDLVLLDMIMPGMMGGETYDRLRDMNSGVKVLLSSGYCIDGEATAIMERGCDGFIQKPFRLSDLSQKVAEILGK